MSRLFFQGKRRPPYTFAGRERKFTAPPLGENSLRPMFIALG